MIYLTLYLYFVGAGWMFLNDRVTNRERLSFCIIAAIIWPIVFTYAIVDYIYQEMYR